jgi:hypothetical protein
LKKLHIIISLAITLAFGNIDLARGVLVTSSDNIPGPKLTVNFSQFTTAFPPPSTPVQIGSLVGRNVTMANSADYGNISYSLGYMFWNIQNGYWRGPQYTSPGLYFTTYTGSGAMTFRFKDGPVQAVGAFVNYDPTLSPHPTITALDKNDQPLESYDLANAAPISTPSAENQGGFRGIVRPQADMYGFSYGNGHLVLTNLTFTRQAVRTVVTSTLALLLLENQ